MQSTSTNGHRISLSPRDARRRRNLVLEERDESAALSFGSGPIRSSRMRPTPLDTTFDNDRSPSSFSRSFFEAVTPSSAVSPTSAPSAVESGRLTWTKLKAQSLRCAERVVRNPFFTLLMHGLTILVLVSGDVRTAAFTAHDDSLFDAFTYFCFALFSMEIILWCCVLEDYFLSFWFLADIGASLSLIFDLTIVMQGLLDTPPIALSEALTNPTRGVTDNRGYNTASRSSLVGARVARLLRVVRLVRLSRILRSLSGWASDLWVRLPNMMKMVGPGGIADLKTAEVESRVGRELGERTTKVVILLVVAMLFMVPLLHVSDSDSLLDDSAQYGADTIFQAWQALELASKNRSSGQVRQRRIAWEMEVLTYVYYHSWAATCPDDLPVDSECSGSYLYSLCWMGYIVNSLTQPNNSINVLSEGHVQALAALNVTGGKGFDSMVSGGPSAKRVMGALPPDIQRALSKPWSTDCSEGGNLVVGVSFVPEPCPRQVWRPQDTIWYTPQTFTLDFFQAHMEGQFVFVYDLRASNKLDALLRIGQTAFLILVLAIGNLVFNRDIYTLVLHPIERMIQLVEKIRQDPLYAVRMGEAQYKAEPSFRGFTKLRDRRSAPLSRFDAFFWRVARTARPPQSLETMILENTIIKLGSLLALGFGQAGSEIMKQNLGDRDAAVNAMVPGQRVEAIYGFCDIKDFAVVTEVLQEKTMVFVNQVATILHATVDLYHGAANRNVGEAFLLVWRTDLGVQNPSSAAPNPSWRSKMADLAVMSLVKVVAELGRDRQLAEYRLHPVLLARRPGFRVSLGIGLHVGWSIEGAIGSEFKIDASYLSPHVNIAARLAGVTKVYGTTILLSEPLARLCDVDFCSNFRPVDHVKLKGLQQVIRLFTVDLQPETLPVDSDLEDRLKKTISPAKEQQLREEQRERVLEESYKVHEVFGQDSNIQLMRQLFSVHFFQEFEKGYLNYEAGEWAFAAEALERTRSSLWNFSSSPSEKAEVQQEDGPSRALIDFMKATKNKAPPDWPGYRLLPDR